MTVPTISIYATKHDLFEFNAKHVIRRDKLERERHRKKFMVYDNRTEKLADRKEKKKI